jgi:hypothetical protein
LSYRRPLDTRHLWDAPEGCDANTEHDGDGQQRDGHCQSRFISPGVVGADPIVGVDGHRNLYPYVATQLGPSRDVPPSTKESRRGLDEAAL